MVTHPPASPIVVDEMMRVAGRVHAVVGRRSLIYLESMPIIVSHSSTNCGQRVMGDSVGRSPNA